MAFLTHGPNQRAYESQSSTWSGPMKQNVVRAGRWFSSQPPQPLYVSHPAESPVYSRLPVLEATELQRVVTTPDRQVWRDTLSSFSAPQIPTPVLPIELFRLIPGSPMAATINRDPSPVWSRLPVLEAVELRHWVFSSDASPYHPGLSAIYKGFQIPDAVSGDLPVQLRKFFVGVDRQPPFRQPSVFFNLQRQGRRNAGRWFTSQPPQRRFSSDSIVHPFSIVNIPSGQLLVQLRRFVTGDPRQRRATEASVIRGIQIPNAAVVVGSAGQRTWTPITWQKLRYKEASAIARPQIPINADLYSTKRGIVSFVTYYYQFKEGGQVIRRTEFPAAFDVLPIELQMFVLNADRQPVQRADQALWIPQLQAMTFIPEELKTFVLGQDAVVLRQVQSWVGGVQIPNPAPPLPIELQQFLVVPETYPKLRRDDQYTKRYMDDTFVLPVELQTFTTVDPRQPVIAPESSVIRPKAPEPVPMPLELQHYVETAFQRYRSHYLVLRGTFVVAPVDNAVVEYLYYRGYTIIKKTTRLN